MALLDQASILALLNQTFTLRIGLKTVNEGQRNRHHIFPDPTLLLDVKMPAKPTSFFLVMEPSSFWSLTRPMSK